MGHRQNSSLLFVTITIISTTLFIILSESNVSCKMMIRNFKIYWNVPTFMCHQYGFNFSIVQDEWSIIQNYGDQFRGDKIAILYDPGLFPALLNTTKGNPPQDRNGGVPQQGNLDLHLSHLQNDIEKLIPERNFKGVGIIDFEHWRPIWRENWSSLNVYRTYSRNIEKKNHPFWPDNTIEKEASMKFEKAAKGFMDESLKLAKKLRPLAIWGYYGYPFCFNYTPNNNKNTCSEEVVQDNNRLKWLFEETSALYPSMYLKSQGMTEASRAKFIMGRMEETNRISRKHSYIPTYPYMWYKYRDVNRFLSRDDLMNSFEIPRRNGAVGAIIWGATNDVNSKEKCGAVYDYLQRILGPTVRLIKKKLRSLSSFSEENDIRDMTLNEYENNEVDISSTFLNMYD
ncbi:hyaluronidase-like [Lycorma delicatula]|uniref:hyaluronidase-like n=1 Tax=Lycorma delicatula TaxID=130591 RepID=UPI003F511073